MPAAQAFSVPRSSAFCRQRLLPRRLCPTGSMKRSGSSMRKGTSILRARCRRSVRARSLSALWRRGCTRLTAYSRERSRTNMGVFRVSPCATRCMSSSTESRSAWRRGRLPMPRRRRNRRRSASCASLCAARTAWRSCSRCRKRRRRRVFACSLRRATTRSPRCGARSASLLWRRFRSAGRKSSRA